MQKEGEYLIRSEGESLAKTWERVCAKFSFSFGVATYNSWLKPLEIGAFEAGTLTLKSPSRFIRDWVKSNFSEFLEKALREEIPSFISFDVLVGGTIKDTATDMQISAITAANNNRVIHNTPALFDSVTDARFRFDNFVPGVSNGLAYNAVKAIAEGKDTGNNTVFIYGSVGSGKTHLLQAAASYVRENFPAKRALYLSAEKFMFQFVKALREKDMLSFKEYLRGTDILLIDDIQFICGKANVQEEFIHTFNAISENGKHIVLSADRAPSDFTGLDERIKSRLGWGLVADIKKPDAAMRLEILRVKAAAMDAEISQSVLEFLADNISSTVRDLEGGLIKVVAQSRLTDTDITTDFAAQCLKDLLRSVRKELTIEEIKRTVCDQFEIRMADMDSARRNRNIARPRQLAMYLAKNLTTKSLPEIGRSFGDKNHTTVIHAVKTIEKLIAAEPDMDSKVAQLTRMLAG